MMKFEEWNISSVCMINISMIIIRMMIFYGLLIAKGSQVTSHYIFSKSSIVFDTVVDVGVILNPVLNKFFHLSYPL